MRTGLEIKAVEPGCLSNRAITSVPRRVYRLGAVMRQGVVYGGAPVAPPASRLNDRNSTSVIADQSYLPIARDWALPTANEYDQPSSAGHASVVLPPPGRGASPETVVRARSYL